MRCICQARGLSRKYHNEILRGVLPWANDVEPGQCQFPGYAGEVELGRDLGSDFFTVVKVDRKSETIDAHVLTPNRTKTHLYNFVLRIPPCNVFKAVEIKVGAEVQIRNFKNVFFKGGSNSL